MSINITKKSSPIPITACATVSACGLGTNELYHALLAGKHCLRPPSFIDINFVAVAGEITTPLPTIAPKLKHFSSRNTQIALAALDNENDGLRSAVTSAVNRYGAHRVGLVIGTSTSGIYETEKAYISLKKNAAVQEGYDFANQHAWVATANYLQAELELTGPCYSVSTACSSSSKTIACAQRLIETGVCDAVLTGGVDSLCHLTFFGFKSLDLMAEQPCTPLDQDRNGISIGEAAGLLLLEKPSDEFSECIHLLGVGESSDAYHMTAPHPEGLGAQIAMQNALAQASLSPADIQYANLHATGTVKNDEAEMHAMEHLFGTGIHCSGTKGLTGHTLGAAGGLEAIITWLALTKGIRPGTCNLKKADESFQVKIIKETETGLQLDYAMSNNFGFGGNNTSLILGRKHG